MLFDWESFDTKDRLRKVSAKDAAAAHVAIDEAFARSLAAGTDENFFIGADFGHGKDRSVTWKAGIEASLPTGDR